MKNIDTISYLCAKAVVNACDNLLRNEEDLIDVRKLNDNIILQQFLATVDGELNELYDLTLDADEIIKFLHTLIVSNKDRITGLNVATKIDERFSSIS